MGPPPSEMGARGRGGRGGGRCRGIAREPVPEGLRLGSRGVLVAAAQLLEHRRDEVHEIVFFEDGAVLVVQKTSRDVLQRVLIETLRGARRTPP